MESRGCSRESGQHTLVKLLVFIYPPRGGRQHIYRHHRMSGQTCGLPNGMMPASADRLA